MKKQEAVLARGEAGEPLLGIAQLAQRLGAQVKTIYAWVHMRQIPFVKVGGCLRFCPKDIDAWLQSRKMPVLDAD